MNDPWRYIDSGLHAVFMTDEFLNSDVSFDQSWEEYEKVPVTLTNLGPLNGQTVIEVVVTRHESKPFYLQASKVHVYLEPNQSTPGHITGRYARTPTFTPIKEGVNETSS